MISAQQKKFCLLVWDRIGYVPSDEQLLFHACPARLKLMAGGVGAGKSYSLAREGDKYSCIENGVGWIVAKDYEQAKPVFNYLLDVYLKLQLVREKSILVPSRSSNRFTLAPFNFTWITKSANDYISLASVRPHVIISDETAQSPAEIYPKLIERSTENYAAVVMGGTFESSFGWYADLWERWQGSNPENGVSFSIPTWSNRVKYPGGRQDKKILEAEATMPPELFQERFGGVPCKPSGIVFKEYDRKQHVAPVAELFNSALPVEVWTDPATHTYPILFVQIQADGKTVHVLDEIYAKDQIAQQIIPDVVAKTWWAHSCQDGIMDIAGTFRAGANTSQVEVWANELTRLGTHTITWKSTRVWDAMDWYDAIHLRLRTKQADKPLLRFADHLNDRVGADGNANGILGELKTHRWPERNESVSAPTRPIKRNEDALSALGYGLLVHFGPVIERYRQKRKKKRAYWH